MTPRAPSALGILVGMLFFSAALRLTIGAGPALAEAEEMLAGSPEAPREAPADCNDAVSEELLAALQAREERLSTRESQVADRMQALRVAEREVREHLEQLRAAEESLEATIATAETANDGDITNLVSVYESMKPAEAAALFEEMTPEFAAGFMARMRPDTAAAVMAGLEPATAYSISVVIAGRNARVPTE
ncbi:hypothetical protein [Salibaculum sp.]|uniref:MotE family protein n=1 Tax=Salibaculum sp. TaxID=2855480 RepID=UPI002B4A8DE5|nr:hypothetical protein [Salibaculum sp.]HKL68123.1 hypothetical protein [Salibaculum sp.]